MLPLKFIEKIDIYEITLDEAIEEQKELKTLINKQNEYGPRISKWIEEKNCLMQELILLVFLKKELFHLKEIYLKQKKRRIKKRIKKGNNQKLLWIYWEWIKGH